MVKDGRESPLGDGGDMWCRTGSSFTNVDTFDVAIYFSAICSRTSAEVRNQIIDRLND